MTNTLASTGSREKHLAYSNGKKFFITIAVSLITLFLSILGGTGEEEFHYRDVGDIVIAILFFWLVWTVIAVLICCTYLKLHFVLSLLICCLHPFMACFAMYYINIERAHGSFDFNYIILLALHIICLAVWFVIYGIVWLITRSSNAPSGHKNTHGKQAQMSQAATSHSKGNPQPDPYAEIMQSMENERNKAQRTDTETSL